MRPRLGISACLLGEPVRHDGAHRRCDVLLRTFAAHVDLVPLCPEVELGLGVPREAIRLEAEGGQLRLRRVSTRTDLTESMRAFAERRVAALGALGLAGCVLKSKSPSCGSGSVPVAGRLEPASGAFASVLERLPHLPLVEETALEHPGVREAFAAALFTLGRWNELTDQGLSRAGLQAFHEAHRWLVLSRGGAALRAVEAEASRVEPDPLAYRAALMAALGRVPAPQERLHALLHAAEPLRRLLSAPGRAAELQRLSEAVTAYIQGQGGFAALACEVKGLAAAHGLEDLAEDLLLLPYDEALGLLEGV